MLAAAVALGVIAVGLPPAGWAKDSARVTIPSLPPAELKIPSLDATIKATAERTPGEKVIVNLTCESDQGNPGEKVPLVVQVLRNNPMMLVSRKPVSRTPQEIAKTECTLTIDSEGHGQASVELPLTWTSDDPTKPKKGKLLGGYYLLISSPLAAKKVTLHSTEKVLKTNQVKPADE